MINKLEIIKKGIIIDDNIYHVIPFEGYKTHFLGINNDNHIALLLKTENTSNLSFVNFKGKNLRILFERESSVNNNGVDEKDRFTVLHLISDKRSTQDYFVEICKLLLQNLGENPKLKLVQKELENVKDIFLNLHKNKIKEELGLWGELYLIYIQNNKEKAITSWHMNAKDRIDFNSGSIKVEVKTTLSNERKHVFKLNQLRNHYKENVFICSIMTVEIENGLSIRGLVKKISDDINPNIKLKLEEKISSVLGNEILSLNFRFFDEITARESLRLYNSSLVPAIEKDCLSEDISKIIFTSNLTNTKALTLEKEKLFS
tara:strand:+ start:13 stop:963 length:951 start_codon:yes stop_codon:yes gene_type:complete